MKKAIPVLIALTLIAIIGVTAFGSQFMEKYTYGTDKANLEEYYGVKGDLRAIVLQDTVVAEEALMRDGFPYFDVDTVIKYLNDGFYVDEIEQKLLYTTATDTLVTALGSKEYSDAAGVHATDYVTYFVEDETMFICAEYVKNVTNYAYKVYELWMQVETEWGSKLMAEVESDTQLRVRGCVKSEILREVAAGEKVKVLEEDETWSKVKTSDSMTGYIETKRLGKRSEVVEQPVTDYVKPEYTRQTLDKKVALGWHMVGGLGGNDALPDLIKESKGMNVISPTWFSLSDNEGNFRSFASENYVKKAHAAGLEVWAAWDNFNYRLDTKKPLADVSAYEVLSSTTKRQKLVKEMVATSLRYQIDGINIDFEGLKTDAHPYIGRHFAQFLRELSVECRKSGLVLSVDNPVPLGGYNDVYQYAVQGKVADYVVIMGYDEHVEGSSSAGSVASIGFVSRGLDDTLKVVAPEKIVNGIPFYSRLWKTTGTKLESSVLTLINTADFMSRMKQKATWDDETCQNYAEWKSGDTKYQIWLEDADSLRVKLSVMKARNIGCVAVWALGNGIPEVWNMINAFVES
jgi:spore germination protein YaaH